MKKGWDEELERGNEGRKGEMNSWRVGVKEERVG